MELKLTGGARIGRMNASFPFATLTVNPRTIELKAGLLGNLVFQPSDIISIDPYVMIPVLGQGIRIHHRVSNYKEKVIFWTFQDPKKVIGQIRETGFLHNVSTGQSVPDPEITALQKKGGFPVKKSFAIGLVVLWNVLFIADILNFALNEKQVIPFGYGILTALGLVFLCALSSLVSPEFRRMILKEDRGMEDIKIWAYFIMLITFIMSISIMGIIMTGISTS